MLPSSLCNLPREFMASTLLSHQGLLQQRRTISVSNGLTTLVVPSSGKPLWRRPFNTRQHGSRKWREIFLIYASISIDIFDFTSIGDCTAAFFLLSYAILVGLPLDNKLLIVLSKLLKRRTRSALKKRVKCWPRMLWKTGCWISFNTSMSQELGYRIAQKGFGRGLGGSLELNLLDTEIIFQ